MPGWLLGVFLGAGWPLEGAGWASVCVGVFR